MEDNIKSSNKAGKALKIAGIAGGVLVLLFLLLVFRNLSQGLLGSSSEFPGGSRSNFNVPQSTGLADKSMGFSNPIGSLAPGSKSVSGIQGEAAPANPISGGVIPDTDKKIIKNGSLNLRVNSVDKAAEKIAQIARDNGGDVFSSNFNQYGTNSKNGGITLKVPFAKFEKTFDEMKKTAIIVITETTNGQDVTEQYTDLQSQLKNKQAEEQAYIKLLDQAQKMEDILSVTRQLSTVRGEIERLQGRIRLMDSQTDMATITASLTEDVSVTIVDSWRPWQVVKESTRELVKSVQDWIDFLIKLVIKVIPVLILYGIIIYIFYRIGRWIYKRFGKKENQSQ